MRLLFKGDYVFICYFDCCCLFGYLLSLDVLVYWLFVCFYLRLFVY